MSRSRRDREEELLRHIIETQGIKKIQDAITAVISGAVDVSDRWDRELGRVDIQRYLGSAIGVANPLHNQIVYGGAVIDPRSIRTLTSGDVVSSFGYGYDGAVWQPTRIRAVSYDAYVQLRNAGVEIDPRDVSDRASRLLGQVYGDDAGTPRKLAVDGSGKLRVVTT